MGIGMSCSIQVKWWVLCDSNKIKFYHSKLENGISKSVHQVICLPVLYHDKNNLIRIQQVGSGLFIATDQLYRPAYLSKKINSTVVDSQILYDSFFDITVNIGYNFPKNIRCRYKCIIVPFPGKWLHKFNYYQVFWPCSTFQMCSINECHINLFQTVNWG